MNHHPPHESHHQPEKGSYGERTTQKTIIYSNCPKIAFLSSLKVKLKSEIYEDLPTLSLSQQQTELIEKMVFPTIHHDGDHVLIKDIEWIPGGNIVYVEALRVKYSTMKALSSNLIHFDFPLYRTGVLTPLITSDRKILFIQRKQDGLFSAPGGFLEPFQDNHLHLSPSIKIIDPHQEEILSAIDLVRGNALKELHEEVFDNLQHFSQLQLCSRLGISMRKTENIPLPVMEFIQPVKMTKYTCEELIDIFNTSSAVDSEEHNKVYWVFDFSSRERFKESLSEIGSPDKPGYFLYLPMIETIFPSLKRHIRGDISKG